MARESFKLAQREAEIERLRVFLKISRLMNARIDHRKLIEQINDEVRGYLRADRFTLYFHDADQDELYSYIASGLKPGEIRIPSTQGIAGQVFHSGKMICLEDAYLDSRFNPEIDLRTGYRTRSILCLPIRNVTGECVGVVQALNKLSGEGVFGGEDVIFIRELIGQVSDLLDMVRKKEDLERQHAALQEMLSHLVVYSVDGQGEISHITPNLEAVVGYSPSEIEGLTLSEFIHEDDVERLQSDMQKILDGSPPISREYRARTKTGEMRWIRVSSRPIMRYGEIVGVQGGMADITALKLMEQYRKIQKIESIGRLAGGVAHDFNNLLLPILGYSEMAMTGLENNDPLYDDLTQIRDAAERAKGLTQQLLAFSRNQVMEFVNVNLSDEVENFLRVLSRLIREDIEVITDLSPDVGTVKGDRSQIQQVLMNLAVNAGDAMPEGGRLTISTSNVRLDESYAKIHADVEAGEYALLSISDVGSGMDAETLRHIFEPFYTTKERGKGTGLGLATVFGIVRQHGGHINVYSEVGIGTVFRVFLPRVTNGVSKSTLSEEAPAIQRGSERILVVEDERVVRDFIRNVLKNCGYDVITAENGEQALERFAELDGPVDLLLTDVIMPQINGKELSNRLSALQPDMITLFMSGYTDEVIARHGLLEASVNFVQKPFTVQSLTRQVRTVLDARERRHAEKRVPQLDAAGY